MNEEYRLDEEGEENQGEEESKHPDEEVSPPERRQKLRLSEDAYEARLRRIMEEMARNPEITTKQLSILFQLSKDQIKYDLRQLRKRGLIKYRFGMSSDPTALTRNKKKMDFQDSIMLDQPGQVGAVMSAGDVDGEQPHEIVPSSIEDSPAPDQTQDLVSLPQMLKRYGSLLDRMYKFTLSLPSTNSSFMTAHKNTAFMILRLFRELREAGYLGAGLGESAQSLSQMAKMVAEDVKKEFKAFEDSLLINTVEPLSQNVVPNSESPSATIP